MELTLGILQALGVFVGAPAVIGLGVLGLLVWRGARLETTAAPERDELSAKRRVLEDVDVLHGLSEQQMGALASHAQWRRVRAGEALGKAGESGDYLFIIIKGAAQLAAPSTLGEITVRVAGYGESFPLAALVGSGALVTSGKALTDMELLAIPSFRLAALCSQEPEIGMRVYRNVAGVFVDRYSKTLERLAFMAGKAVENAEFLANI